MRFDFYRLQYFNLILLLLFLLNQFFLFCLFIHWKYAYVLNKENENEFEFDFFYADWEDIELYNEFDIDDEFMYTYVHMENYLLLNCRFSFDYWGGNTTLDNYDFFDLAIYKNTDERNKKYIYEYEYNKYMYQRKTKGPEIEGVYAREYAKEYEEYINTNNAQKYKSCYNENVYITSKNDLLYNLIKNQDIKNIIMDKQRYRYKKRMY